MERIWIIVQKELALTLRTRMTLFTVVLMTVIFALIPLGVVYGSSLLGAAASTRRIDPQILQALRDSNPTLRDLPADELFVGLLVSSMQSLFLLIPLITPLIIAVYSIIGEKQTRSLEAVLATPVETSELLAGKCLAAAIPGILSAWLSYTVFLVLAAPGLPPVIMRDVVLRPEWLVAMALVVPAGAFMAVIAGLIVSSRASDPQSAQQIGSLVVLPVIGLLIGQVSGVVRLNLLLVGLITIVLLAIDAGLLAAAVRLFQRESILTRWK
ncbi:MAG TPA: ABC transporter permease subunit [Chloroflexia bacterium]|nr:ABC transporter permease subunit [Chloroflexia bacterium]